MTDWLTLLNTALVVKLGANSNLATLVGSRMYDSQAPFGTPKPYLLFQHIAGGEENNSPRDDVEVVYQIEVVAATLAQARNGRRYIHDALHNEELTIVGWSNYKMMAGRLIGGDPANVEGEQNWRRGQDYDIGMSVNS